MKKSLIFVFLVCLLSLLTSCSFFRPHRMDIEQGNIITQDKVNRLRVGMSEAEVKHVMGSPMLVNLFTPDRIDYIYTMQRGYQPMQETRVICLFKNGRLIQIITS